MGPAEILGGFFLGFLIYLAAQIYSILFEALLGLLGLIIGGLGKLSVAGYRRARKLLTS